MSKKLSYEFIKNKIENEIGYKLLSKEYKGYYDKLLICCDKGHHYKTSWNVLRAGSRCPICYRKNQSKSMLMDFEYIKNKVEERGFELISNKNEYKGHYSRLKVECPNGHYDDICWAEFRRQRGGCSICSGVKKKTLREIKKYMLKFGYKCLSKRYINGQTKLKIQCPENHIYYTTWFIFQQGSRCPKCNYIKQSIERSGQNCIFWKGGISKEPYCQNWTQWLKIQIKERDGNKCLNPECTSGQQICVHHIDYNKKNCHISNLITVCKSCNSKANRDRKWHELWYKAILLKRYNYKY